MKRQVLCLLGPNGCGKGTIGDYLKSLGAHIFVTSDILEEEKKSNHKVREIIHHHKNVLNVNVPCEIAIDAMMKRVSIPLRHFHDDLFVLDGMGRTPDQITLFYERIRTPKRWEKLPVGYVFLTLSFEEAMERIRQRREKAAAEGRKSRDDDDPEIASRRYETYLKSQELLIARAREVTGLVSIYDLGQHTTLDVAARIYGSAYSYEEIEVREQIMQRCKVVAA